MKKIVYIFVIIGFLSTAGNIPSIIFKENKGQWPDKVLFGADFINTKFYLNKNSFNYCVYNSIDLSKESSLVRGHNYEVNFIGGNLNTFTTKKPLTEYFNYFLGKNKDKWASNVKAFKEIEFLEVYKGISLHLYSNEINLKYDFIISPNANPNLIKLNYNYIDGIEIRNKELVIKTSVGEIIEKEPIAYQIINGSKRNVICKYTLLSNNTIGFIFPNGYDRNYALVIDPVVVVCSYSGSSTNALNSGCTYDENGNIFTISRGVTGYPTTVGAFQVACTGLINFLVSGYNANGSSKTFSTFIGGDSLDDPFCIVARKKELIIMGRTCSKNFPTTITAFDTTFNGQTDIAICKLNDSGSSLVASTFIGGSAPECNNWFKNVTTGDYYFFGECVCDSSGNVYAITNTQSLDFPVTAGAIDTVLNGGIDACVFKLDKNLSNLIWNTFLGGSVTEDGKSIRLDGSGGVYCLGTTNSTNFPTTPGCISPTKSFGNDMFVTHINSTGSSIINSTYLGTTGNDIACLLDVDQNNDVYISGQINNPALLVPKLGVYANVNGYNTIYKVNSSLNTLLFKTKFGNVVAGKFPYLMTSAFRVDSCQNIYIAGFADDVLPTTSNAFNPYGGGTRDIYMGVFKNNCTSLLFASYYGGAQTERTDGGISHFDPNGVLYQGFYVLGGIPTTPNAYSATYSAINNYEEDGFLKIDLQTHVNASSSYGANIIGCPPFTPTFVSTTNTGTSYWDLGDGTTSILDTVSHTYTNLGTYNVLLVVTDTNTCNRTDSIKSILNVINPTTFDLGEDLPLCINMSTLLQANVTAVTYSWSTGQTTSTISVNQIGSYTLTINNGGCNTSDDINVVVGEKKLSERFPNVITPNGDLANDFIDFTKYDFEEVEFVLYDRWGKERYKITNPTEQWQPNDLINGTYYYVVNYQSSCTGKHQTAKGFISVFK